MLNTSIRCQIKVNLLSGVQVRLWYSGLAKSVCRLIDGFYAGGGPGPHKTDSGA